MNGAEITRIGERAKQRARESFDNFMSGPQTKLIISLVPPTNPPELLSTLLQAAFNAGFQAGAGDVASTMVEAILKADKRGGGQS